MAGSVVTNQNTQAISTKTKKNYKPALVLLTSLFFMWGFITCLNDILIPHLKALFVMNYTQTMLIQFVFFGAYFLMSIPSGWIVGKIGYKKGIVLGLSITGLGAAVFYPASVIINYNVFLIGFFILASGITILQVSANPYVAALGSPETASARLNLTQALNSFGTTVAPIFGAYLILSENVTDVVQKAESVQLPYIGIAVVLFAIAAIFLFAKMPRLQSEAVVKVKGSAWQYRHLVLGALAIFLYVGAEVSIGSFMINFFAEDSIAGLKESAAAKYVALYWGGAMVGRFFGAVILSDIAKMMKNVYIVAIFIFAYLLGWYLTKSPILALTFLLFVAINVLGFKLGKNKPSRTLAIMAGITVLLVAVTVLFAGHLAMWTIIAVGLFNSIMFPTIFTLAIDKLGNHTSQGSGILCMAIVGGALVPLLMGFLADTIGIHSSFIITIICYAYIAFYGIKGYIPGKWNK